MDLRVLVFALSMYLAFDLGEGIQCHICNGYQQAQCKDPFSDQTDTGGQLKKTSMSYDCDTQEAKDLQGIPADAPKATMCRKIYQDVRGDVRIIRGCAWEAYKRAGEKVAKKTTCYKTVMEEYNTYVCTCETENCNGAKVTHVSALLIAIVPLITFGIFHQ